MRENQKKSWVDVADSLEGQYQRVLGDIEIIEGRRKTL
jgi:hypothetical protein